MSVSIAGRNLSCMKLYVYDHCPYCVKARMIFGFKDLPYEMVTLLNDDVETPMGMIGQKMVPILQKEDGSFMPESMDIVHYVDQKFGMPMVKGECNPAVSEWIAASREYMSKLCYPRWVRAPLDEFATESARAYFTQKKEASIGSFADAMKQSDDLKERAQEHVAKLAPLIKAKDAVNGQLSEDDIHLFAALRSLSIVRGIEYPETVAAYRKRMAERAAIPLHDRIAL